MIAPDKPIVVVVSTLHFDIMVDAPNRPRQGETVEGTGHTDIGDDK